MNKNKKLSYQIKAVSFAINHLNFNDEFNLQAPTGCGKTFIVSMLIDKFLEDDYLNSNPTSFIFISPSIGSLAHQSYEKISSYLNRNWVSGYETKFIGNTKNGNLYLDNIDYFEPNTVYFIGWQMLSEGTKITNINSEKNNIYKIINNTKEKNISICLIIDEAHREIRSNKNEINSKKIIIESLNPFKTIKLSATLEQVNEKVDYKINYEEVRNEEAIKQNVIISSFNKKIKDIDKFDSEVEQLIISAIEKQKEIKKAYHKKNIKINPLILIQIPDKIQLPDNIDTESILLEKIYSFLDKQGFKKKINYSIWLDKHKWNSKQEIIDNKSNIDILIFKSAIATGWDIPRANILVRIREAKTKSFNIQTLGRILRNPNFKYYNDELIDNAFVYTKDEKYKEYIKQESIVIDAEELKLVKRSKIASKSEFKINKVLINNSNYNENELIKFVSNEIILRSEFKNDFFNYKHQSILLPDKKISSKNIFDVNQYNFEEANYQQTNLNFSKEVKISLFDLYIKFRTITKSSSLISLILDEISNNLKSINKKIKDFYWACCYNWNKVIFIDDGNQLSLKELIIKLKNTFINKKIFEYCDEYSLPKEYKVSSKLFDTNEWDEINTFDVKLKIDKLLSKNEEKFYFDILCKKGSLKNVHIFKNGTSPKDDYYIEYLDDEFKKRKFFPDFIFISEDTKSSIIFEAKGHNSETDIDKNTRNKINRFVECLNKNKLKIANNFNIKEIIKVSYIKNDESLSFEKQGKIVSFNDIMEIIKK